MHAKMGSVPWPAKKLNAKTEGRPRNIELQVEFTCPPGCGVMSVAAASLVSIGSYFLVVS